MTGGTTMLRGGLLRVRFGGTMWEREIPTYAEWHRCMTLRIHRNYEAEAIHQFRARAFHAAVEKARERASTWAAYWCRLSVASHRAQAKSCPPLLGPALGTSLSGAGPPVRVRWMLPTGMASSLVGSARNEVRHLRARRAAYRTARPKNLTINF